MQLSRAARLAAYFVVLDVCHDLADHVVQTDQQAVNKSERSRRGYRAMLGHVASYTTVQAVGLASLRAVGLCPPAASLTAAVAWSAGSHAFLDRRWPVKRLLEKTGSSNFARPQIVADVRAQVFNPMKRGSAPFARGTAMSSLPLHGPYLADQSLHRVCLLISAAILAWRNRCS